MWTDKTVPVCVHFFQTTHRTEWTQLNDFAFDVSESTSGSASLILILSWQILGGPRFGGRNFDEFRSGGLYKAVFP